MLAAACSALASACGSSNATNAVAPPDSVALSFDLRFKGVGVLSGNHGGIGSDIPGALGQGYPQSSGSPLTLGLGICSPNTPDVGCAWVYTTYPLAATDTGLSVFYLGDFWSNLGAFFQSASPNDTVVTSLDFERADSLFAFSALVTSVDGGYTLGVHTVAPSGLQAAATGEGAQRRVITALSFMNGQVEYFSYGWQHDMATHGYDAQIETPASIGAVPAAAQSLAAAGYTITGFGGDSTDGFILVGTRLHGVTTPRTLQVVPNSRAGVVGYATVAFLFDPVNGFTVIAEK